MAISVGSLMSGIGGFEIGLQRVGMRIVWQVEVEPFCQAVLVKRFQLAEQFPDVRLCGLHNLPVVDLICAGFPCPAFSRAGKRGGFSQDNLFYEEVRITSELAPTYLLLENVEGFTKWREEALSEIEAVGYEHWDGILDARDFGIPQARRRWFAICVRRERLPSSQYLRRVQGEEGQDIHKLCSNAEDSERWRAPTNEAKEEWRAVFANSRRVREAHGIPNRMDRLRALGNAVVPSIAEAIGHVINRIESERRDL
jgi:DNA-cytosine methyltransferase